MAKSIQGCMGAGGPNFFTGGPSEAVITGWVFGLLGNTYFEPRDPAEKYGTEGVSGGLATPAYDTDADSHTVSFSGTLRHLSCLVQEGTNERISIGSITVYKNGAATDLVIRIGRKQDGIIRTATDVELDFVAGDTIYGVIDLPAQDESDPEWEGNSCVIAGVWCEMDTGDDEHWGVQAAVVPNTFVPTSYIKPNMTWAWGHFVKVGKRDYQLAEYFIKEGNFVDSHLYTAQVIGGNMANYPFWGEIAGKNRIEGGYSDPSEWVVANMILPPSELAAVVGPAVIRDYAQAVARVAGTASNMHVYFSEGWSIQGSGFEEQQTDPARPFTGRWYYEVNGADSGLGVAMLTEPDDYTVGLQLDTSNEAAVASGDLLSYGHQTVNATTPDHYSVYPYTQTESARHDISRFAYDFLAAEDKLDVFLSISTANGADDADLHTGTFLPVAGAIGAAGATSPTYWPIFGGVQRVGYTSDYAEVSLSPPFCTAFERLRVRCIDYTGDPLTIRFVVNGVDDDQSITITGTGEFENTTDITYAGRADVICMKWETASGETFTGNVTGLAYTHYRVDDSFCPEEACVFPNSCPDAYTIDELKQRALRMLGEDPDSPVYWSLDEMADYVNMAYLELCRETKALEAIEAVDATEGAAEVTLSRNVMQVFRVSFDDYKLFTETKWNLDRTLPLWEQDAGRIERYIQSQQDNRRLRLFRKRDGSEAMATGLFQDGFYTYLPWSSGQEYDAGDRVTRVATLGHLAGHTMGYVALQDHTAELTVSAPETGTDWASYWRQLALLAWHTRLPDEMEDECDEPELPQWFHLAIAYRAASKAQAKYGEQRGNPAGYEQVAKDYVSLLKGHVANRAPERRAGMRRGSLPEMYRPQPWHKPVEDS